MSQQLREALEQIAKLGGELYVAKIARAALAAPEDVYARGDYWAEKYQEQGQEILALRESHARLVEALEKLACLGNGDKYGNSIGNEIAQDALAVAKEAKHG